MLCAETGALWLAPDTRRFAARELERSMNMKRFVRGFATES